MNDNKIKEFAEATVNAIFQSTLAVFYVDVQHDWFNCVRCSNRLVLEMPNEGVFSTACNDLVNVLVPETYQAEWRMKLSCEYIRNHLNRETPEFSIKSLVSYHGIERWVHLSIIMIDMENCIPHHIVLAVRNITKEQIAQQHRSQLIDMLSTKLSKRDEDIVHKNKELFLQNQELTNLNLELLKSRDQLFELADSLQHSLFQNNMYREMLQMQQTGVVAYDCHSLDILYMNESALSLYEMKSHEYEGKKLHYLREKVTIIDNTPDVADMPILKHIGSTAVINCSILHQDGSLYYVAIASKNIILENGKNIVVDIVSDVTNSVLKNRNLENSYWSINTRLTSVTNALTHFADYIYHVDLTDGIILDNFTCSSSLKPLEYEKISIPCSYDYFIEQATNILGLEFTRYNGKEHIKWNSEMILSDFYAGNSHCEIEFWHKKNDTYHRLTGLIAVDPATTHVMMTAIGNDITTQRKQEYENQRLLKEAQKTAEETVSIIQKQQLELQVKHASLETAFGELMEFNSIVQGLQTIFDSCYYWDIENNSFTEIKSNYLTRQHFKTAASFTDSLDEYMHADVKAAYHTAFSDFTNKSNLKQRVKDKPYIVMEYESNSFGWIKCYIVPAQYNQNSEPTHYLYICKIIDEEKLLQNHLRKIAETDGLTGISNRTSGEKKISDYLDARQPGVFGILDCDDFKGINDHYGHSTGDKVLITVANSLQEALGRENVVLRLGGDEFSFYLVGCTSGAMLNAIITKFFAVLNAIHLPQLKDRRISVSVGAAIYDGRTITSFEELYKKADQHLYESKKVDGNYLTF